MLEKPPQSSAAAGLHLLTFSFSLFLSSPGPSKSAEPPAERPQAPTLLNAQPPLPARGQLAPPAHAPLFLNDGRNLSPYITPLSPTGLPCELAARLAAEGRMRPSPEGLVLDERHLMLVSWDQRGIAFEKSAFRSPSSSHSAALAIRSRIVASSPDGRSVLRTVSQEVTVISFLPNTLRGITESVRIFPAAFKDPRGIPGRNWQQLDLLFDPNSALNTSSIVVSASHPIQVSDGLYRSFVRQAHDLEALNTRYFVLGGGSAGGVPVENCIGALKGVSQHLPQPEGDRGIRTFTMRGEGATDRVATELLRRAGIASDSRGSFGRRSDGFVRESLLLSAPCAALRNISWYTLRSSR